MSVERHPSHYQVLGVSPKASYEEIRQAWKRIARETHPDQNPGDHEAEARFKQAALAKEVLTDLEKRSLYDQEQARHALPKCRRCGEVALAGLPYCVPCGLIVGVQHQASRRAAARPPPASAPEPASKKGRRTAPSRQPKPSAPPPAERMPDPDLYDDLIGRRRPEDYSTHTGDLGGDSILEVLMAEAAIRSSFEGRRGLGFGIEEGSTLRFSQGETEIRIHVDPGALRDLNKNLRMVQRMLQTVRKFIG